MSTVEDQIQEVVDRETRAWDTQDVELLAEGPGDSMLLSRIRGLS